MRADTFAVGPHGGVCADCKSDHMHWLGGGLEGEHALSPELLVRVDLGVDELSLTSDECSFERTGQRVLAAGGLRVSAPSTPGFFAALTGGLVAVHEKSTCPRASYDTSFGYLVRPQLGWDIPLSARRWLRLEVATDLHWWSALPRTTPVVEIDGGVLFAFAI